jgi:hypothetical protein
MSKNIINFDSMFSMNDYQKMKMQEQYNKLYDKSKDLNEIRETNKENQRFYNLSIKQIMINLADRLVKILNELVDFINDDKDKTFTRAVDIITKDDHLIYLGIFIIIVAIFLFFISGTS